MKIQATKTAKRFKPSILKFAVIFHKGYLVDLQAF